jgi:hypothetical protein
MYRCALVRRVNSASNMVVLLLLVLDLILVYVKLLGEFRQRLVVLDRGQCHFRFESRQMVSSFASHSSSPVVAQITSGLSIALMS